MPGNQSDHQLTHIAQLEDILGDCLRQLSKIQGSTAPVYPPSSRAHDWWDNHEEMDCERQGEWQSFLSRSEAYESGLSKLSQADQDLLNIGPAPEIERPYSFAFDLTSWEQLPLPDKEHYLENMASTMMRLLEAGESANEVQRAIPEHIRLWWEQQKGKDAQRHAAKRESDKLIQQTEAILSRLTDEEKEALSLS